MKITPQRTNRRRDKSKNRIQNRALLVMAGLFVPIDAFQTCHRRRLDAKFLSIHDNGEPYSPMLFQSTASDFASEGDDDDDDDGTDESYEWQVGNVYDDIDKLSQIITMNQASDHLQQVKRRTLLDYFAAKRRLIRPDFIRFVLGPLALASFMATTKKARIIQMGWDMQFWTTTVVAPILLLCIKRRVLPPSDPLPKELEAFEPEYRHFVEHLFDWEDPRKSCRDVVLSLLENWVSSIAGMALFGIMILFTNQQYSQYAVVALLQALTRLGAIASLHQFPKLYYELRHQPLPLDQNMDRMQRLTRFLFSTTPIGVAADLSKLMAVHPNVHKFIPSRMNLRMAITLLLAALGYVVVTIILVVVVVNNIYFYVHPFTLSMNRPLVHLIAIRNLLRIQKSHDISLATDRNTYQSLLSNPEEMEKRIKWRYRIHWREPQRMSQTFLTCFDDVIYRLFFENTVPDKFMKESQADARQALDDDIRKRLFRMEKGNQKPIPPMEWKSRAMDALAAEHQRDYESGQFKDPLGVAIQQTLGIGLAYSADHMTPLQEGEEPTSRRLQARTAKSAIRRVQAIYSGDTVKQELSRITDPTQREEKKKSMRQRSEIEIQYLRDSITNLVPIDDSDPVPVKIFREKSFKKISPNEFLVIEEDSDDSISIADLSRKIRLNANNDSSVSVPPSQDYNGSVTGTEDDFVEAWRKQHRNGSSGSIVT